MYELDLAPLTAAVRLLDTDVSLARLFANMTMVPNIFGEGELDGSY